MLLEEGVCYDHFVLFDKTLLAFDLLHFVLQSQICLLLQASLDFLLLQGLLARPYILNQTHSHNIHLKLTRLELTIERSYQTQSHNITRCYLKITRLVRRFLLKRNMSSSKIHCYID